MAKQAKAETQLAIAQKQEEISFKLTLTTAERDLIKKHVMPDGSTDGEFALFIYDAQSRGLNPLKKQIYCVKYQGKASHQVSIDGYRAIAFATSKYDGQTSVLYGDEFTFKPGVIVPEYAEVSVYRKDVSRPFTARVYYNEFVQQHRSKNGNGMEIGSQWAQRPRHMLAKCAEALALRKAFPEELSGLYTTDEMTEEETTVTQRGETIEGEAEQPKETKQPVEKAFMTPAVEVEPTPVAARPQEAAPWAKAFAPAAEAMDDIVGDQIEDVAY